MDTSDLSELQKLKAQVEALTAERDALANKRKRGSSPGHIEKRGANAWRVTVVIGKDEHGEPIRHRHLVHGAKKDAEKYLSGFIRDRDLGRYADPERITLKAHVDRWLETVAKRRVRAGTLESYSSLMRCHVLPELGKMYVDRLKVEHIEDLYTQMLNAGKSSRTVRYVQAVLHSALQHAVRRGLIPGNPTELAELPKLEKKERPHVSPEDAMKFLDEASKDRWGTLFLFAMVTGMRPGEYRALLWTDIDLKTGIVAVRRVIEHLKGGGWRFNEPKTSKSRRSLTLPPEMLPILREHRKCQLEERLRMGSEYKEHGLVFASLNGGPVDRRNLTAAHLKPVLKAAGLSESIGLYGLRHSCATLLLAAGKNPKIVAERLGHSTITLTMDTYSHVTPTMQQEAADALSGMLFRPKPPKE